MGLRVYMKSGNNYYVDVSEYLYDEVYEQLTDAILYGDNYSIDAHGKTYFFKGVDVEYFELETQQEVIKQNKIGF